MKEITVSYRDIEITFTADLIPDRDAVTAYASGYGYAFDAIDRGEIESRAHEFAMGAGLATPAGTLTDEDEIAEYLEEQERGRIQDDIDDLVRVLMGQIDEIRELVRAIEGGELLEYKRGGAWSYAEAVGGQATEDARYCIHHQHQRGRDEFGTLDELICAMQEIAPLPEWTAFETDETDETDD